MDERLYRELMEREKGFFPDAKTRLIPREMTVCEFLEGMEELAGILRDNAEIYTPDFGEFCDYARANSPHNAEFMIAHERSHAQVAEGYGLDVHYGVVIVEPDSLLLDFLCWLTNNDLPRWYLGFMHHNMATVARHWQPEEVLRCLSDISKAPYNLSELDLLMVG